MLNTIIISTSVLGYVLLLTTSLKSVNEIFLNNKNPPKIFYIINGLTICFSSTIFIVCSYIAIKN